MALDYRTERNVAIKIIKSSYYNRERKAKSSVDDEILVMKNLDHSGIVKLYDHGTDGKISNAQGGPIEDVVYIVMEYVAGESLFDC